MSGSVRPAHLLWTTLLLCCAYGVGSVLGWGSATASRFMGDFGLAGAAAASSASCLLRARTAASGRLRAAWSLLGASAFMVAVGNGIWGWYEVVLRESIPTPSAADFVFLFFAPLAIGGLLLFARQPQGAAGWTRLCLDGWLIAGSLFTLGWSLALARTAEGAAASPSTAILTLAYPVFDIVLISLVLVVRFRAGGEERAALNLALAGLAVTVLCDGLWTAPPLRGDYHSGELLDSGWFTGSMLLACAPWMRTPSASRPPSPRGRRAIACCSALVPYLAAGTCMLDVLGASLTGHHTDPVVLVSAVSVVIALVLRQAATLLDNVHLARELAAREVYFRSVVQRSSDVIMITDAEGILQYASPAMRRVFGFEPERLTGTRVLLLIHPADVSAARAAVAALLRGRQESSRIECRIRTAQGAWRHIESTVSRHGDGLIINSRDVTERVMLREQLAHHAYHDPLTGLPNRALFVEALSAALAAGPGTAADPAASGGPGPAAGAAAAPAAEKGRSGPGRARRSGCRVCVLFLDLDGFKAVNDTAGHAAGDELLEHTAARLRAAVRSGDLVARFGGDEFAVLLRAGTPTRAACEIAHRIVAAVAQPYSLGIAGEPAGPGERGGPAAEAAAGTARGDVTRVSASVGVAFADPGLRPDELLRDADAAMYRAKAAGKGRVVVSEHRRAGAVLPSQSAPLTSLTS